jgi:hypothetical protein
MFLIRERNYKHPQVVNEHIPSKVQDEYFSFWKGSKHSVRWDFHIDRPIYCYLFPLLLLFNDADGRCILCVWRRILGRLVNNEWGIM